MRTALPVLLFANLAFFAWAAWIDVPQHSAGAAAALALPELKLASEVDPGRKGAARVAAPTVGVPAAPSARRCAAVGPFNTAERSERAMAAFRERGFVPRQRAELGETWDGYWVYVGGLESAADEARVLRTLSQAGLNDARVMPQTDAGRRVSVGLFSERPRAERRARALQRLGLQPEIGERRVPGTVYWVDIDLGAGDTTVSTEGLLEPDDPLGRLEVRSCPPPA